MQQTGRRIESGCFIACLVPAAMKRGRLAITASRRIGGAVVRNRIKRVVRDVYRKQQGKLAATLDVVIIAKTAAARASHLVVRGDVLALFGRVVA